MQLKNYAKQSDVSSFEYLDNSGRDVVDDGFSTKMAGEKVALYGVNLRRLQKTEKKIRLPSSSAAA